ncbi:dehydrogenase [Longilinea arvoryzae]|uniref:Dehydrogenase n=2 Tax=Longilinea arvoryzae TaxID=360412 RepID=A0A0S7B6L0_9CHLR|nr:dehydrogenase [Longilinea arvoryzae]
MLNRYLAEYKWSNIFAMLRNLRSEPRICSDDFNQRLVVITGASSGIGWATAKKYATHRADLLFINRNEPKTRVLCEALKNEYNINCSYILADFMRLSDIYSAVAKLSNLGRNIDVLIHNAGIYNTTRILTADHLEATFQINYLSTFILNYSLKEKFRNQASGRILFVNSEAYRFAAFGLHLDDLSWNKYRYSGIISYGSAKLAQLLSMLKLNEFFRGSGVTINAMHPGNVKTNSGQNNGKIYRYLKKLLLDRNSRPVDFAAEALYYLGVSNEVVMASGKFFNLTTEEKPAPPALDMEAAEKLWEVSLELGGFHEKK